MAAAADAPRKPIEPPPSLYALRAPDPGDDDVIGFGADLSPGTLLAAYRTGLFPMNLRKRLAWWSPDRAGVLRLDDLVVTKSLRRSLRRYEVRFDTSFETVMRACGDPSRDGVWITDEIVAAYRTLHDLGWAHSVEAWDVEDGTLAGGLYGVAIGGLFAGESMFHHKVDASKVALVRLVELLRSDGEDGRRRLLDVQWRTDHLATLGVVEMARSDYLATVPALVGDPTITPLIELIENRS